MIVMSVYVGKVPVPCAVRWHRDSTVIRLGDCPFSLTPSNSHPCGETNRALTDTSAPLHAQCAALSTRWLSPSGLPQSCIDPVNRFCGQPSYSQPTLPSAPLTGAAAF